MAAKEGSTYLRQIKIPSGYEAFGKGFTVDVTPCDDSWLLNKDRTWDEVDSVLEGRLQGIQSGLTNFTGGPPKLAKDYGLEVPVSSNLARLMAYIGLVDENRQFAATHSRLAQQSRQTYEDDKLQLRSSLKSGSNKYQRAVQDLRNHYEPFITGSTNQEKQALAVNGLIFRKAAMDFFSAEGTPGQSEAPLVTRQFARLVSEADQLLASSPGFSGRDVLAYFIGNFSQYLSTTKDIGLFVHCSHRTSPDIIRNYQDCQVLINTLCLAVGKSPLGQEASQLKPLGNAFLKFLVNQASYHSSLGSGEGYHYLSLMTDMYTAAGYCNRPWVLMEISQIVDSSFYSLVAGGRVNKEVRRTVGKWNFLWEDTLSIAENIRGIEETKKRLEDISSSPELQFFLLQGVNQFVNSYPELLLSQSSAVTLLRQRFEIEKKRINSLGLTLMPDAVKKMHCLPGCNLGKVLASMARVIIVPDNDPSMTKRMNEMYVDLNSGGNIAHSEVLSNIRSFHNDLCRLPDGQEKTLIMASVYEYYLAHFYRDYPISPDQVSHENQFLWRQVLDDSLWFVSPRGDRFRVENDPELTSYAIDSITYRIDPLHPREHQAQVLISGLEEPLVFWLDAKGNFLNLDRSPVVSDPIYKDRLENLLLKRLYVITSGKLHYESPDAPVGDYEEGPQQLYRRAHYRILTSTEKRAITMESASAQEHARLIKDIYGIDIYQETKRRRQVCSIRQDQYLTFVKETTPEIQDRLMLPNDLQYDPELVQIS